MGDCRRTGGKGRQRSAGGLQRLPQGHQLFGPIILGVKPSVEKGELDRLVKVYNKMELYARGVYKNNAAKQSEAMAVVDRIADALEANDIKGAQSGYSDFLKVTSLPELFKGPKGSNYHLLNPSASMATR